jgi:hypothetical protein
MKYTFWLVPAVLLLCANVHAQEIPAWELSGVYSYLRANLNQGSFSLNGGIGSITQNVNDWFGGRLEFAAYHGTEPITNISTRTLMNVSTQTITYGPVFSYRRYKRLTPFGEFQLGAVHANAGYLGISASAFKFALSSGGGVDFQINPRAAIRVQGDYLMTRFLALRQDNVKVSAGLVIRFGTK